jgi:hypothetical protein
MEKEFVPYELALELKELGFDEPCFAIYEPQEIGVMFRWVENQKVVSNKAIGYVIAPLCQQAFRWFREKYNLVHTVYSNASGYIWELHYNKKRGGTHICDSGESGDCEISGMFTAYEKAELECLKKLIEIVKNSRL